MKFYATVVPCAVLLVMLSLGCSNGVQVSSTSKCVDEAVPVAPVAAAVITAGRGRFLNEETTLLRVVLTNFGASDICLATANPLLSYQIDVRDTGGHEVQLTAYGKQAFLDRAESPRNFLQRLSPGQSIADAIPVGRIFDLSLPGEYTIHVARTVRPCGGHEIRILSNVVTVQIGKF
ncbi:MAG: hypothetical protein JWP03_308 [Phycisphaerales bacterium]|nr:hypothetical protein [Phycisphaerales bacterium]